MADMVKGLDTKAYATVADMVKGLDTKAYATVAEHTTEELNTNISLDVDVPPVVLCIAMLAVVSVMHAQLEAALSAILQAFAAQLFLAFDLSAQLRSIARRSGEFSV